MNENTNNVEKKLYENGEDYKVDTKWIRYLLYDSGLSCYRIQRKYGVASQTTTRIKRGESHLDKLTLRVASILTRAGKEEYEKNQSKMKRMDEYNRELKAQKGRYKNRGLV